MATDCRISTALPAHPKTKKLVRRLGPAGGWALVCLFLWSASNRSDGDLSGLSDEDIELAADWAGEEGAFVRELAAIGFVDGSDGQRKIHDWEDHNPWAAGADQRSLKAKWNAAKRHHGEAEADRLVPEYAAIRSASSNAASNAASNAPSTQTAVRAAKTSNAPSPSPSPSPSLEARATRLPQDWTLPDEWAAWAKAERPELDATETSARFADYWHGKAGKDGRKADWLATWRNWVRNERAPQPRQGLPQGAPALTVASDAARRTAEELLRRENEARTYRGPTPEQKAALNAAKAAVKVIA